MHDYKLPSHIRISRVELVVDEIKLWMSAHQKVIERCKNTNEKAQYSEGVHDGLQQALEIIEKNIFKSRKTEG